MTNYCKIVTLTDTEWNRKYGVVGKEAIITYPGETIGTLVKTIDGEWVYYFRGQEGFDAS